MANLKSINSDLSIRPRIALITNHGYAGVEIPVGGAPDTGGQNIYVNALAMALEELGMEVTVFSRGGFPFFKSDVIREGIEMLSEHVRYVYIPGGGDSFIRKEDIAPALDEEIRWLEAFILEEAQDAEMEPWDYYECINTHYWDAAIIGIKLIERWQDKATFEFLKETTAGLFAQQLNDFNGDGLHRNSLSREIITHLGKMARAVYPQKLPGSIVAEILPGLLLSPDALIPSSRTAKVYRSIEENYLLGKILYENIECAGKTLGELYQKINTHVWTPHSLSIIKERNFWTKNAETIRKLKFRERNSHEEVACHRIPLYCSTSPKIWNSLFAYHHRLPEEIFDFPPCIDESLFRPRSDDELESVYQYLSEQSEVPVEKLKQGKIVFESSRMDKTKRKDILLESFSEVVTRTEDTYLFIGGGPRDCEVFQNLKKLLESLPNLKGRAFLLGYIDDEFLAPLFSVATLFASASEMEGFGMSASQSAAAGVAVVTSDLVPFATQYAAEEAVIVKAGDVKGFSEAIYEMLTNDDERELRARQLYRISKDLNWNTTAYNFVNWYRKNLQI